MKNIGEEYGDFIIEAFGTIFILALIAYLLNTDGMLISYLTSYILDAC